MCKYGSLSNYYQLTTVIDDVHESSYDVLYGILKLWCGLLSDGLNQIYSNCIKYKNGYAHFKQVLILTTS